MSVGKDGVPGRRLSLSKCRRDFSTRGASDSAPARGEDIPSHLEIGLRALPVCPGRRDDDELPLTLWREG